MLRYITESFFHFKRFSIHNRVDGPEKTRQRPGDPFGRRHSAGETPTDFLNARLKAASDS
jgi:hypothetical protein